MRRALHGLAWWAAGVAAALVLLELVFRTLPVSVGLQRTHQQDRWPLQYTEPRLHYSYSVGWAMLNAHRGVTNNYGHVAPFDFRPQSRPVVVIGDSYIESLMNDYADSLQGQLGRLAGAPDSVYGLGVSGASASGYVALAALARAEFRPTGAVILLTDGDLSESLLPAKGTHYLRRQREALQLQYDPIRDVSLMSRIRQSIGDISLHRYFQVNLQFAPENVLAVLAPIRSPVVPASDRLAQLEQQRRVADWFLDALPTKLGLHPSCIALLLDTDRYSIYKPSLASTPKDRPEARQYLIDEARRRGFGVTDLGSEFSRRYAREREKFDHWPLDRHWNARGHGVAAAEAYRLLANGSGPNACLARSAPAQ